MTIDLSRTHDVVALAVRLSGQHQGTGYEPNVADVAYEFVTQGGESTPRSAAFRQSLGASAPGRPVRRIAPHWHDRLAAFVPTAAASGGSDRVESWLRCVKTR